MIEIVVITETDNGFSDSSFHKISIADDEESARKWILERYQDDRGFEPAGKYDKPIHGAKQVCKTCQDMWVEHYCIREAIDVPHIRLIPTAIHTYRVDVYPENSTLLIYRHEIKARYLDRAKDLAQRELYQYRVFANRGSKWHIKNGKRTIDGVDRKADMPVSIVLTDITESEHE
jgi:hypothetical protein